MQTSSIHGKYLTTAGATLRPVPVPFEAWSKLLSLLGGIIGGGVGEGDAGKDVDSGGVAVTFSPPPESTSFWQNEETRNELESAWR